LSIRASDLATLVGTHLFPFTNPRVVCPPGRVRPQGRANIVIATPLRSGTHILIDLILNNLPAYRNHPLYVDLDQCAKQDARGHDLLGQLPTDAGYVLKTHMPLNVPGGMAADPRIASLIGAACVVTIRRNRFDVCRSLGRWYGLDQAAAEAKYGPEYDRFWDFWEGRPTITVIFEDLFREDAMRNLLAGISDWTGTQPTTRFRAPPTAKHRGGIYATKMLTRIAGRRAPRVDTTIHTLKS
jgi:hypothetical protein